MTRAPHFCHWPGCREQVPPRLFACKPHWYALPWPIRRRILETYVPGQEITKTPSPEYIEAAKAAQEWIKERRAVSPLRKATTP